VTENHLISADISVRQSPPADISVLDKTQMDPSRNRQVDSSGNRQADSGGNRQVDSGGNQDQATDQKELNPQDDAAIGPQASKDDPLPGLPTLAQSPEPQSNITTAPSVQALSIQAPPVQAPPIQAPPVQAPPTQPPSAQPPSAQAPSTQAPSAQAPLASPSSYEPPQPAQQSLPAATASTLPLLHMDQPTYDPLGAHIMSICQPKTSFNLPFAAQSSAVIWEKEHPSQGAYTTSFTDRRYRQQYQNPPPAPPFRPPVSRKAVPVKAY